MATKRRVELLNQTTLAMWVIPVRSQDLVIETEMHGDPVAHQRPRLGRHGGAYTPRKTAEYKTALAWRIKEAMRDHQDQENDLYGVQALFFRSNRQRIDVDNLLKSVLDAATQAGIWRDDSQVTEIAAKLYVAQEKPCVKFMIYKTNPDLGQRSEGYTQGCEYCRKPIARAYPSVKRRFCSKECHRASAEIQLSCTYCSKKFTILRSMRKNPGSKKSGPYDRQFCSRECSVEFHREQQRKKGKASDGWRCTTCGGPVSRKEYTLCRACSMATRSDPTSNYWKLRHAKGLAK